MDTGELKVKSFRADDDTFEKFKAIANDEFGNQGQCLAALINLYETEKSKATLIERKVEIESFQTYLNKIAELFLMSLQLNQDAETRIRGEFERLLSSKDRTILDLQLKVNELETSKESSEALLKEIKEQNKEFINKVCELENTIERQNEDYASALADKNNLNKALTDTCNERKLEIEELRAASVDAAEQLKNLKFIESENKRLSSEIERLTTEINTQKELLELEKQKALLAVDKVHQQELKEVYAKHHVEIKDYINRIDKLQEQHRVELEKQPKKQDVRKTKKPNNPTKE